MSLFGWLKKMRRNNRIKIYLKYYEITKIHLYALNNLSEETKHNIKKIENSLENFKDKYIKRHEKDGFVEIGKNKIKVEKFSYRDIPNREIYRQYGNYFKIHSEMLLNQYGPALYLMVHLNDSEIREYLTSIGDDREAELLIRYVNFLRISEKLLSRISKCRKKMLYCLETDDQKNFWENYDQYNKYLRVFYEWYKRKF